MKKYRWISLMLLTAVISTVFTGALWGAEPNEAVNRIVAIVDCSGSFKNQYQNAVKQIQKLLETMSQVHLKRWEGTSDQVVLISMDALPQILWKGSIQALKAANIQDIVSLFSARKEFAACTDVFAAFDLALQNLDGDPKYVSKYLFIFSDLIHEPPAKSVRVCNRPMNVPDASFPWHLLEDVSTTVFWMPADQQLVWKKAIEANGLQGRFMMYSTGFSEKITISAPPKPQVKVSDQETADRKQALIEQFSSFGKVICMVFLIGLMCLVAFGIAMRFRRNPRQPRPVPAGVPRMPVAMLSGHPARRR